MSDKIDLSKLLSSSRDHCEVVGCKDRPVWKLIFALYGPCGDKKCSFPHLGSPLAIMTPEAVYCEVHKKELKFDELLSDESFELISNKISLGGFEKPRKDWTTFSFHKILDNVIHFGPRLVVSEDPELPPSA